MNVPLRSESRSIRDLLSKRSVNYTIIKAVDTNNSFQEELYGPKAVIFGKNMEVSIVSMIT
jgi:hypothetical protein